MTEFRDVDGKSLSGNIFGTMWVLSQYTHRNIKREVAVAKIVQFGFSQEVATKMVDETLQDDSPSTLPTPESTEA